MIIIIFWAIIIIFFGPAVSTSYHPFGYCRLLRRLLQLRRGLLRPFGPTLILLAQFGNLNFLRIFPHELFRLLFTQMILPQLIIMILSKFTTPPAQRAKNSVFDFQRYAAAVVKTPKSQKKSWNQRGLKTCLSVPQPLTNPLQAFRGLLRAYQLLPSLRNDYYFSNYFSASFRMNFAWYYLLSWMNFLSLETVLYYLSPLFFGFFFLLLQKWYS